jgi:hypothetical protein
MTQVQSTFNIRRFWFNYNTPENILAGINWHMGTHFGVNSVAGRAPYVDIHYWGDSDRNITIMELKYSDYIFAREELTYTLEGDDGLGNTDDDKDNQ